MKTPTRRRALWLAIPTALLVAAIVPSHAGADNLLPNAGFEDSPTDPSGDVTRQPLVPTGWVFEGSAGLFDHSENDKVSGRRMIAISAPLSGKRRACAETTCVDNPATEAVEDDAALGYTVAPHWRTALPVAVEGGERYELRVWARLSFVTEGEGVSTKVRWLDASGAPISVSNGPRMIQGPPPAPTDTEWTEISDTMKAPATAAGAIVMLGHTMDTWLGQVRFDDAFFGLD